MEKEPESTPAQPRGPGKPRGGGHGRQIPTQIDDMTPRERLDHIHGLQALQVLRTRKGQLVERAEIDKAHAEMVEVLRSDLIGALPLTLAGALSGQKFTPQQVRQAVLDAVNGMIRSWADAEIPVPMVEAAKKKAKPTRKRKKR